MVRSKPGSALNLLLAIILRGETSRPTGPGTIPEIPHGSFPRNGRRERKTQGSRENEKTTIRGSARKPSALRQGVCPFRFVAVDGREQANPNRFIPAVRTDKNVAR